MGNLPGERKHPPATGPLGIQFLYEMTSYKNLYKNKVVDPSEKRSCAKIELIVTKNFDKNGNKRFNGFSQFYIFGLFDLQNDFQIQI